MPQTILVVDDEPQIVKVLRSYLEKAGFRVVTAADGQQALAQHKREKPDLVLLDLNLPGADGIDVASRMRSTTNVPIIMVTARVEETDRLVGLEVGADDYITKPFSPREVVARVRAVLRRSVASERPERPSAAEPVELDVKARRARVGETALELTRVEFDLLACLLGGPERVHTRAELIDRVWGDGFAITDRTIDSHVKALRRKLAEAGADPSTIETVRGVGYRVSAEPAEGGPGHE